MITHTKTDHRIECRRGRDARWVPLIGDAFDECRHLAYAGRFLEAINRAYEIEAATNETSDPPIERRFRCVTYSISVHIDAFEQERDLES